jgi:hypothetical protein
VLLAARQTAPIWPVVVLFAVVSIVVFFRWRADRKRSDALRQFADDRGLQYIRKAKLTELGHAAAFRLFRVGRRRRLENVMRVSFPSFQMTIFDYCYSYGHGTNVQRTAICFQSESWDFPTFSVTPRALFQKISALVGLKGIVVESPVTFSQDYVLRGNHAKAVRDLFNGDVAEFYEHLGGYTEAADNSVLMYGPVGRLSPRQVENLMETGLQVLKLLCQRQDELRSELTNVSLA